MIFYYPQNVLRTHWAALLLGLCVGLLYLAPHLYFAYALQGAYTGVYMSGSPDEEHYMASIRRNYDQYERGNPYIFEERQSAQVTRPELIERSLGWLGNVLGLSITTLALTLKVLVPTVLFLLVYLLAFVMSANKGAALLAATAALLGNELAQVQNWHTVIQSLLTTLSGNGPFHNFLMYNRPVNPGGSALLFLLALLLTFRTYTHALENRHLTLWLGVVLGLLAYIYFFYWVYALALVGIIMALGVMHARYRSVLFPFLTNTALGLLIALPYLFVLMSGMSAKNSGLEKAYVLSRTPVGELTLLVPLLLLVLMLFVHYKRYRRCILPLHILHFMLAMLLAGLLAVNQHLVSGYEVQLAHFHFYIAIPIALIVGSLLFYEVLQWVHIRAVPYGLTAALFFLFLYASQVQVASYRHSQPVFAARQEYGLVFSWLERNARPDAVILSSDQISELIPMYTNRYVYSAPHAAVYPMPKERLLHNYFVRIALEGVTSEAAPTYFANPEHRAYLGGYLFDQYWRERCGSFACFPDTLLDDIVQKYITFSGRPLKDNLAKYKLNYVLWDTQEDPEWQLERYAFLEQQYSTDGVYLYAVTP